MKKLFFLLIFLAVYFPYNKGLSERATKIPTKYYESFTLDTLTIYHPVVAQCDSDPLITASSAKISLPKLRKQKIRWMALSRDMLTRWNGRLSYGDTVQLVSGDKAIDGLWIIQDTMNKRYKKRGDLLFDQSVRKRGRWLNVKLYKKSI